MEAATKDPINRDPEPQEPEDAFGAGDPGEEPGEDGYQGDLVLEGTGQLSLAVGGKAPTSSSLRLQGGKVDIEGSFNKGERLILQVEVEVRGVEFRDEVDGPTGQVVGCSRNHKAHITAVERV